MPKTNLVLIGDKDGMYKYIKSPSKSAKASPKTASKAEKNVVVKTEWSDSETENGTVNKRKAQEMEPDDDDYMKFAMDFVTERLLKHADKEEIAQMLVKFGVPRLRWQKS